MPLQDLYDPGKGFLLNDKVIVEADVNVRKLVDYWAYDSKKETGFVGLKNQGATCYMNSLLQTLYHIPYFRKVFFCLSISGDREGVCNLVNVILRSMFHHHR